MTKHAVVGLTRTLSRARAKHAITVNAICRLRADVDEPADPGHAESPAAGR